MRKGLAEDVFQIVLTISIVAIAFAILKRLQLGASLQSSAQSAGEQLGAGAAGSVVNSATGFFEGLSNGIDKIIPAPFGMVDATDANSQKFWSFGVPSLPDYWQRFTSLFSTQSVDWSQYQNGIDGGALPFTIPGTPSNIGVDQATQNLLDYIRSGGGS